MGSLRSNAHVCLAFGLAAAAVACNNGGGGGGGAANDGGGPSGTFEPTTPPADVCALLTQTDAQTILPTAAAGAPEPTQDTPDNWNRICKWKMPGDVPSVQLVLFGALTEKGLQYLKIVTATGPGNGTKIPVAGVGDQATYWESTGANTRGLTAIKGSITAGVTAYFIDPPPTQDKFVPLVQKALAQL